MHTLYSVCHGTFVALENNIHRFNFSMHQVPLPGMYCTSGPSYLSQLDRQDNYPPRLERDSLSCSLPDAYIHTRYIIDDAVTMFLNGPVLTSLVPAAVTTGGTTAPRRALSPEQQPAPTLGHRHFLDPSDCIAPSFPMKSTCRPAPGCPPQLLPHPWPPLRCRRPLLCCSDSTPSPGAVATSPSRNQGRGAGLNGSIAGEMRKGARRNKGGEGGGGREARGGAAASLRGGESVRGEEEVG